MKNNKKKIHQLYGKDPTKKREKKKNEKNVVVAFSFFFILLVSHTARRDTVDTHMYIEKKGKNKNISTLYSFRMLL